MGRKKNNNALNSLAHCSISSRKDDKVEEEAMDIEDDESSKALVDETLIGSDKTSADYYFDSYSHFGIHEVSYFYGPQIADRLPTYDNIFHYRF